MVNKKLIVQSIVFEKKKFPTKHKVQNWINRNDYKCEKLKHITGKKKDDCYRCRQLSPRKCNKSSYKRIKLKNGVTFIYAKLKK